jgi:hypothetical protein
MPRSELPFADGFYVSEAGPLAEKRCVNMRPVIPETDAASVRTLLHTEGITELGRAVTGTSRGAIVFSDGVAYRVIGTNLYSLDQFGGLTSRGTVGGEADVSMDSNGINICIVDPFGDTYFYTPVTNIFETEVSAAFDSFGQATSVTFKSGFYVFTTDTNFFSGSDKSANDGKDFNSLDFLDADINPDIIMKGFNDHNQLYIGGSETIQVYRAIVTTGFPFELIPGALIPKGFSARNAVTNFDASFIFLGGGKDEKPGIYKAVGSNFQKLSTSAIETQIHKNTEADIAAARAFTYAIDGNHFAVFTIGDNTFVYDQTASRLAGIPQWHERQTGITNGEGFKCWRAVHGVLVNGKIQVGDDRSGLIGELDSGVYKEYGCLIEKMWSTKPFINQGNKIFSNEVELFMETGVGNVDENDPQIRMDYSDDGSKTFTAEIPKTMGAIGTYKTRVRWKRLGAIPLTRVLRWKTTAPNKVNVFSLFVNASGGKSG